MTTPAALNVLGGALLACSYDPLAGFSRSGCCEALAEDLHRHTVCVRVTAAFLAFSAAKGMDLATPQPQRRFRGLEPGDRWCLAAARWLQACDAGVAPPVVLEATHECTLDLVPRDLLLEHAWQPARGRSA